MTWNEGSICKLQSSLQENMVIPDKETLRAATSTLALLAVMELTVIILGVLLASSR
jgi:hypothetical protein